MKLHCNRPLQRFNVLTIQRSKFTMITKIKTFFTEVKVELQKSSWPWDPKEKGIRRYKELTDSTLVVIIAMLVARRLRCALRFHSRQRHPFLHPVALIYGSGLAGKDQWFVVHVLSGQENKVRDNIEKRVKTEEMSDRDFRSARPDRARLGNQEREEKRDHAEIFPRLSDR